MPMSLKANSAFRTLYQESLNPPPSSLSAQQYGLFVISSPEIWAERWSNLHVGRHPTPELPRIDVACETVVLLTVGSRPVLGYRVAIEDLVVEDRTLVVTATEIQNANGLFKIPSWPVHVVAARIDPHAFDDLLLKLRITATGDERPRLAHCS